MTVYVDLVFFTNLALDGSVLLLTAKVRSIRPVRSRLFVAAFLGAIYAAAMFWVNVPYLYSFGAKIAISLLMVVLTFGYGGPLQLTRNFVAFYTVNFATLGGVIGINYLIQSSGSDWGGMRYTSDGGIVLKWQLQLGLLIGAFLLSSWLFHGASVTRQKRQNVESLIWDVEIKIAEQSWMIKGLLDTGNRLYDPLTRIPVMIVEAQLWKEQLPQGWSERLKDESVDLLLSELDPSFSENYDWSHRFRIIPYRAVNGSSRLILAVKPDSVVISYEGNEAKQIQRILIGLDGGTLSSEGAYRAIVHPDMVQAGA
ncbi:MAG: sigma-E processing peptidase SpoIIGA [Candidatus Cohnella colombiensis]|uniref:Sigma-E processing peptidase SpoIIGA n=1 Tax=Candidatus Cohnella colombiensis TaxID=3121368 RepID=A0AA95EU78_9BACL|nr:MAG: sigma-E processing peptidase SpoIIGA [Cohnella sp.]